MLFQSFTFPNGTTAKNRFFKSAMEEQLAIDNQPTQALVNLYRTWALGGAGVLLSALFFADKIGRYLRVQSSPAGELMVYDVTGQVFFANANSFWQVLVLTKHSKRSKLMCQTPIFGTFRL